MIRRLNESDVFSKYVIDKLSDSLNDSYDVDRSLYSLSRHMKENQYDFGSMDFDEIQDYIDGIKNNLARAEATIKMIENYMNSYYE